MYVRTADGSTYSPAGLPQVTGQGVAVANEQLDALLTAAKAANVNLHLSTTPQFSKPVSLPASAAGIGVGAICFTWDDGYASHDVVRQYATALGQKHTFFLTSDLAPGTGNPTYLSAAQILQAFSEGHEIGAHGQQHTDVTTLAAGLRPAQYDTPKSVLEGIIGAGNVKTFAYPYGGRNATTDSELYLRYDRVAGISYTAGSGQPPPVYPAGERNTGLFVIGRVNWDNSAAAQARVLNYIRMAAKMPIVVSFYAHALDGSAGPSTANMQAALQLANQLGVPCLTLAQAFPAGQLINDPGCEDTTMSSWGTVSTDPSSVQEIIADTPFTNFVGSKSLHLKCTDGTKAVYVAQPFPIIPGRTYSFSGRVRAQITSATGGVYARIRQLDAFGTSLGTNNSVAITAVGATAWQQFVATLASANVKAAFGTIECVVDTSVGEAWFDHLHVAPQGVGTFG